MLQDYTYVKDSSALLVLSSGLERLEESVIVRPGGGGAAAAAPWLLWG